MRATIDTRNDRSDNLPTMAEVDRAIRDGDPWELLDLRDRINSTVTFSASSAMSAVEGLRKLNEAITGTGTSAGAQRGRERPVEDRAAEVRAAMAGQGEDDLNVRRRADSVRASMEGNR